MNRRSTALVLAIGCLVILFAVALLAPLPYVLLSPGPTENTLGSYNGKPVISVKGHPTYPTTGELRLTTVSETRADYHPRLPQVLSSWFSSSDIVVPRDAIYQPSQSIEQVQQQNTQEMLDSQSSAVVAGLGQAGINAIAVTVTRVVPGSPAEGKLQKGDEITSVDGKPVDRSAQAAAAIQAHPVGSVVRFGILRDKKDMDVAVTTRANPDDSSQPQVGIGLADEYDPPFKVSITLGQSIGGPSAGLIFSLAIYDTITPGALTGGRSIAGTGTIDADGNVGEIGGVQQKIAGAYSAGATVFLTPAANCAEAARSSLADKVELLKVDTLDEAVHDLRALDDGKTSGLARCG